MGEEEKKEEKEEVEKEEDENNHLDEKTLKLLSLFQRIYTSAEVAKDKSLVNLF